MDPRIVAHAPALVSAFFITAAALVTAVLVHELAHAVVGYMTGLRVARVMLGPIEIRDHGRPRVRFVPSLLAGVVLVPWDRAAALGPLRWSLLASTAAGPVAGLVLGIVMSALAVGQRDAAPRAIFEAIGQMALVLGLLNLLPLRSHQALSDGRRIVALLVRNRECAQILAATLMASEAMSGRRPRDWDPALLALMARSPNEGFAHLFLYEAALDRGEIETAGHHLDAAIALCKDDPTAADAILFNEAAYYVARHRGDARAARAWLGHAEGRAVPSFMRARYEAAVLCAEGRALEGRQRAVAGLAALERAHRRDGGPHREQLEELARGAGTLVRPLLSHAH